MWVSETNFHVGFGAQGYATIAIKACAVVLHG
jgi:hypothetical protein